MLRSWTGGEDRARQAARPPSRFDVRPLGRADQAVALRALDRNPVRDVFIASRILHDGALTSLGPSPLWGAFDHDQELQGLLHVGPNLVPATDDEAACQALAAAAGGLYPTRMLVGERVMVELLWSMVGPSYPAPREVRRRQYVYALEPDWLAHDLSVGASGTARLAERSDEDRVLRLSAAMYTEEMGENPMARDPDGYRRRVRMLSARGWTYVYEDRGRLQFKMDVGCASDRTAQIQGVYVPPELRGRGVGTTAMTACCALAFARHPNLSLYVNDFNAPAVALYERIGFRRASFDFQTIMLP
ncbi:MAG TPA: GNAT family N-acetyltransferase [Actinomycetes bacterium]|nr:GNAT family N-acetyltransferase [Actinomycetes bacterium]